ncbi:uncharacterized protein LOC116853064 isoform X2 [Odontomachus brunneus]|uniref:uncharacterized protein LOC116853064 isoform X2 n=1 Tax=Odontomachus brunneus TaxID=486640 RepID=UPI0013F25310|nr:uncharacterized protein LOC116853064 isoform X2 [Odontomachus brunneus]
MRLTFYVKQYMIKAPHIDFVISFDIQEDIRMKTLIVIVCMLTIIVMVHSFSHVRYYKFQMNLCRCDTEQKEMKVNLPERALNGSLIECAFRRDGAVFDKNVQYSLTGVNDILEDIIYDQKLLAEAKEIFLKCYNKTMKEFPQFPILKDISYCSGSILSLLR